jgi:Acyl-CoA dehydrogenase, C-terminal domain
VIQGEELELFEHSLRQATARHTGTALDATLVDLGWLDALESDAHTAISLLFPLQGAANATSFALDRVLMTGLNRESALETAVVMPPLGSWSAPGQLIGADLTLQGLGTSALRRHSTTLVVARTHDPTTVAVVEVDKAALTLRCVAGVDPDFGLVEVSGDSVPCAHRGDIASSGWDASVGLAQVALGYELVGAARTMLELARDHALNRVQFGQPIGRFQAVRHRLADTLVAIEAADAVLAAAGEDPSPQLSAAAKALSGRGARTAGHHCQQVLAGIGFTAEHPFHRYLRRVLILDQLFGTSRSLTETLGHELLACRRMPTLLPL